jgi:hypothetical protein
MVGLDNFDQAAEHVRDGRCHPAPIRDHRDTEGIILKGFRSQLHAMQKDLDRAPFFMPIKP